MARKENHQKNHSAHEAWCNRKREMNATPLAQQFQKIYRLNALRQRETEGRLTDKNRAELARLGG